MAHFAFLDYLSRTAVKTDQQFPKVYGVVGSKVPDGFLKQQAYPIKARKKKAAVSPAEAMQSIAPDEPTIAADSAQ